MKLGHHPKLPCIDLSICCRLLQREGVFIGFVKLIEKELQLTITPLRKHNDATAAKKELALQK
jgi:hypothetical protein